MKQRRRRALVTALLLIAAATVLWLQQPPAPRPGISPAGLNESNEVTALSALATLEVKGRAAKTGYDRSAFGDGWQVISGCDMRNRILARDLVDVEIDEDCKVLKGTLSDPYTGEQIAFVRGPSTSDEVQIDHVVALSDAWQKGASYWTRDKRVAFANDPLELLAVDGQANQNKGSADAASWLPPNKPFRCQYVARQIATKQRYSIWVTSAEKSAMQRVLAACPDQRLPNGVAGEYTKW